MEKLTQEQKQEIVKALQERGAKLPCPRCGHEHFTILNGYFVQSVQTELAGTVIGGPSLPSAIITCKNCGFLSQHALGAIGLLPKRKENNE